MDPLEFAQFRKILKKTQQQIASLLGKSVKAVHSYEQGWRSIPADVERQILFLILQIRGSENNRKQCWTVMKCPKNRKNKCPAWEFKAGNFCWFINGTICQGKPKENWKEKIKICRNCEVLAPLLTQ